MDEHEHHDEIIKDVSDQFGQLLKDSDQAIYIYFDDNHKICNQKFADLLGYNSPEEWAGITESFPQAFVADKSQEDLVSAYTNAMEKFVASKNNITWKKKDGSEVETEVILVPLTYNNHPFALHFII